MVTKYLDLQDITAYRIAFEISNYVCGIVIKWDWFAKKTVGEQFVDAVDSISPNIAEGFGRYGKKDKIKFYRYSRGSVKESVDWNEKSFVRKLLTAEQYTHINNELKKLPKEINYQIKLTNQKLPV